MKTYMKVIIIAVAVFATITAIAWSAAYYQSYQNIKQATTGVDITTVNVISNDVP
ncbi:MAG: hypothetical protein ACP5UV_04545 [Thermoplasmata archaeon]